ncbi:MAG: hypothetical protein VKP62_06710 [Candidatus Sericytochromatia bacterium]|nr:hypothetical protein [Candidatus Sericytochromatia bacterium]
MPIARIPFQSPPPFDLPEAFAEPLTSLPVPEAAERALDLLGQLEAGDVMAFFAPTADGGVRVLAARAGSPLGELALAAWPAESAQAHFSETPPVLAEAQVAQRPLLCMGQLDEAEAPAWSSPLQAYFRAEGWGAQLGFLYVYPCQTAAGRPVGALWVHRALTAGPLNHDQPAIVAAVASLLCRDRLQEVAS